MLRTQIKLNREQKHQFNLFPSFTLSIKCETIDTHSQQNYKLPIKCVSSEQKAKLE